MSETACAALGVHQLLHFDPVGLFVGGNDHLGNPFPIVDDHLLV